MLDKVVILSCKKQAYLIFTDRSPIGVSSDTDVTVLLRWFFGDKCVQPTVDSYGNVVGLETRRHTEDEITKIIDVKEAA